MRHDSQKSPENIAGRVPQVVGQGRRLLRSTARRAGATATTVARESRRILGRTVDRTERYARRNPWMGLGAAACTGACIGALLTFFYFRD